jgi:hypothetical protein
MLAQEDDKMVSKCVYTRLYQSSMNMITAVPLAAQKMILHVVSELVAQVFWQLELTTRIQDGAHENSLEHQIIPCPELVKQFMEFWKLVVGLSSLQLNVLYAMLH